MSADPADIVRSTNREVTVLPGNGEFDVITGEPLSPDEINFRVQIDQESAAGFIAVDTRYASLRMEIHQPIVPADLPDSLNDDIPLTIRRPHTALALQQLPLNLDEPGQQGVVELVRHAAGEFPARVMHHLYAIANDPPNYRRNKFRVRVSDLLDRLGYARDRRGIHYSVNRTKLTRTLFALYLTSISVQGRTTGQGRKSKNYGFVANLLSTVGYLTSENVGELTVQGVFERGLPEIVEIEINPRWYEGVRRDDMTPGRDYRLLPKPPAVEPRRGRRGPKPGGAGRGQSRTADLLRAYIQRCKESTQTQRVLVERRTLLGHAGITNSNMSMAVTTLKKALTRLIEEGTLVAFTVKPSKVDELFELSW